MRASVAPDAPSIRATARADRLPGPSVTLGSEELEPAPIHTLPPLTATAVGTPPMAKVRVTCRVVASMRETVRSSPLRTQTAPEPAAILTGFSPTGVWETMRRLAG